MSALVWSERKPTAMGFYWLRPLAARPDRIVEVMATPRGLWVRDEAPLYFMVDGLKWAGPIARPKEPSRQQLAAIRYQLYGSYLPPRTHYWGANPGCWEFVDRAEILQRVRQHLTGCYHEQSGGEADSAEVTLCASAKRNGRWVRLPGEKFTAATIEAAIAAARPKNLPAVDHAAGIVNEAGQHGSAADFGAPVTAARAGL